MINNTSNDEQASYDSALTKLKTRNKDTDTNEIKNLLARLIFQVESLKGEEKQPVADLTKALENTHNLLEGTINAAKYEEIISKVRGESSTGMKVLGGLMLLLSITIVVASIVFPASAALALTGLPAAIAMKTAGCAIATAVGLSIGSAVGYGGYSLFSPTPLSRAMNDLNEEIRCPVKPQLR